MNPRLMLTLAVVLLTSVSVAAQQNKTRDQMVREDREKVTTKGFWIYNDFEAATEKAKQSEKPILVVLRCIPCEECVKLDDDLVDQDPELRPLLEQFVCVRIVSTNGLDLSLFQYDTDQSFAVFMLNADRTIYGRFGTRSHRTEWIGDVSLQGLAEALKGALELHAAYPGNKDSLVGKTGPKPLFDRPERLPSLREKFTSSLDYSGDVAKSCIHCHQIGDAQREYYRSRGESIPDELLNPYPHPKSIGLIFDPNRKSTLKTVQSDSISAAAGLTAGDQIVSLNGQPILSLADVQWVLHSAPGTGAELRAVVQRSNITLDKTLSLPDGWRTLDDISWRVSAWGLRRMVTGGMVLESIDPNERGSNGLPENGMALRIQHVGQYGAHAAAKNAGFQKGDVVVSYDERSDLMTDSDVLRYGVTANKPGESVSVKIVRAGKPHSLKLPIQN